MISKGFKFGKDWADMTPEEKSEKLIRTSPRVRTASHAAGVRKCCICDAKVKKGQEYRQAHGSKWLGHETCIQEYNIDVPAPKPVKKDGITIVNLKPEAKAEPKVELQIVKPAEKPPEKPPEKPEPKIVATVKPSQSDLEEARKLGYFQALLRFHGIPEDAKILSAMAAAADFQK